MTKKIFLIFGFLSSGLVFSQVGINNDSPKATLDVTAKAIDGSRPEGIIPPRLTGDALRTADLNGVYGPAQNGAIVFVTAAASVSNQTGQVIDVNAIGLYYFDSTQNKWVRFG